MNQQVEIQGDDFEAGILDSIGETFNDEDKTLNEKADAEEKIYQVDKKETDQGEQEAKDVQSTDTPTGAQLLDVIADQKSGKRERYKTDKDQNVVDATTGEVIAKAGNERRLYEEARNARGQLEELQVERQKNTELLQNAQQVFTGMKQEIEQLKQSNAMATQLGMSPQETLEAVQMYAEGKQNPLEVVKKILTKAKEMGYNIEELDKTIPLDLKGFKESVVGAVKEEISPLRATKDEENRQQQLQNDAATELSEFRGRYSEAEPHLKTLGDMMLDPRFQHLSLTEAWLELKIALLQQQQSQPSQNSGVYQVDKSPPLGRGAGGVDTVSRIDNSPVAPETDYRDILKGVIRDLGEIGA